MTRTSTTLLALIAAANLAFAGGPDTEPGPVKIPPVDSSLAGAPDSPQGTPEDVAGVQDEVPTDVVVEDDLEQDDDEQQDATRTLKGQLRVERSHDSITLQLKGYRLDAKDKLPLSVLAGREVELVIEKTGRGEARVVNTISPRGWSGDGVVRPTANGLELINDSQRLNIVGLPEGVADRIKDKKVSARGWVFEGSNELVFSGASARIIVAMTKDGTPSETAFLNERTVGANGKATYGNRHYLTPGDEVFVFDIASYRRAERDDEGKIVKDGIWRESLADTVGEDIQLVRATVTQREGNGITGWIPLRKVAFGELAGPPSGDPTPPAITDVPEGELPGGLAGALDQVTEPETTPEAVQGSLEEALGVGVDEDAAVLESLVGEGNEVDVDLDPSAGDPLDSGDPTLPAIEPEAQQGSPQVDIDLGAPIAATAMVTATELNVRTRADHRSPALLVALHGDSVKILEDTGARWVKVELPPPSGFVCRKHLEPVGPQDTKLRTFSVVPSHLKLREQPDSKLDNVASYVLGGTVLQAVGERSGWVKIQQSEPVVGYVVREALNLE